LPELPEVETTCRGISPHVTGQEITAVVVRQPKLRYPIPPLVRHLVGREIVSVRRRGKYLIMSVGSGYLLIHLGMSGSLRLVPDDAPAGKHDHIDWVLASGQTLRFTDPRRFGIVDWIAGDPCQHKLIVHMGPEPLEPDFSAAYLYSRGKGRKTPVKSLIMDSRVVVGVGNIYANEALFRCGIHPLRESGKISCERYGRLVEAIKSVLASAIEQGGTTLRDFVGGDGKPGYFKQSLHVYGRAGQPCTTCSGVLKEVRVAQRSTVYCPKCQR